MTNISKSKPIKCVSFDAGGTLIHLAEDVGVTYSRIAATHRIEIDPVALNESFRTIWKLTPPAFHPDATEVDDEKGWWKQLVKRVFEHAIGKTEYISNDEFDQFFHHLYEIYAQPEAWKLDPDAYEVLDKLDSKDIQVAMISNFDDRLIPILQAFEIADRFSPLIISNEVKASKPSMEIYDVAIARIGLSPNEILHVGDDPISDHQGAIAAEMQSLLVGKKYGQLRDVLKIIEN